jgi:hypothetical protein
MKAITNKLQMQELMLSQNITIYLAHNLGPGANFKLGIKLIRTI